MSRPREEEREEVGEVRRIIPLLPALWLTAGRESKEANWFAAQNSEGWGWSGAGESPLFWVSQFKKLSPIPGAGSVTPNHPRFLG